MIRLFFACSKAISSICSLSDPGVFRRCLGSGHRKFSGQLPVGLGTELRRGRRSERRTTDSLLTTSAYSDGNHQALFNSEVPAQAKEPFELLQHSSLLLGSSYRHTVSAFCALPGKSSRSETSVPHGNILHQPSTHLNDVHQKSCVY
jgi:hypothetical protein